MEAEKGLAMQAEVDAKTHNEPEKAKNEKAIYVSGNDFDAYRLCNNSS